MVITNHLGGPVKAADTLAAVYVGNITLVQTIKDDTLSRAVGLIRTYGHRPHFVNFLLNLCGTAERPVPKNQVCVRVRACNAHTHTCVGAHLCTCAYCTYGAITACTCYYVASSAILCPGRSCFAPLPRSCAITLISLITSYLHLGLHGLIFSASTICLHLNHD